MPRNCERRGVKDLENIFIYRIRLRMQKKLGKVRSIVILINTIILFELLLHFP